MAWTRGIEGLRDLDMRFTKLRTNGATKLARAGVNASLRALVKALKSSITASRASPELQEAARLTLAKRLIKQREGGGGKAGFGVGQGKARLNKITKSKAGHEKRGGGGVGVSSNNVHWFVLGTEERNHDTKVVRRKGSRSYRSTGNASHRTGKVPPILAGFVPYVANSASAAMIEAARLKIEQEIEKEMAKKGH
jgi:hypothetical protein